MSCERDIRFELLARLCPNATGADLRSVCTEAGMFAIRARRKTVSTRAAVAIAASGRSQHMGTWTGHFPQCELGKQALACATRAYGAMRARVAALRASLLELGVTHIAGVLCQDASACPSGDHD